MSSAPVVRNHPDPTKFNDDATLPYQLRLKDFELVIQDVYDFFYDVNVLLTSKGLQRLDDMLRPAIMSGVLSDMLAASIAKHSRTLVQNTWFNWAPRSCRSGALSQRCSTCRIRWSRNQDHQKGGWSGGYPRRSRSMDVRVCV